MPTKTLAIVIPCYNYAHFLGECLESVLAQSILPDEIIVVDDESTDNTREICENIYAGLFNISGPLYPFTFQYIWQKNKGLSGARNTGISFVKSDYVMCLDADDMLRPDAIKEFMALAGKKNIAQCGLTYFGTQNITFRPEGANLESLLRSNTVYCNSVFPKSAWEATGGFDESEVMRLGLEDWLFWIECSVIGLHVLTSDYIALLYRRHDDAMTKQTTHPRWDEIIKYMAEKIKKKYGLETHFHSLRPNPTIEK